MEIHHAVQLVLFIIIIAQAIEIHRLNGIVKRNQNLWKRVLKMYRDK